MHRHTQMSSSCFHNTTWLCMIIKGCHTINFETREHISTVITEYWQLRILLTVNYFSSTKVALLGPGRLQMALCEQQQQLPTLRLVSSAADKSAAAACCRCPPSLISHLIFG